MESMGIPDINTPDNWGDKPIECPRCGNRDINRILMWYKVTYPGQEESETDITTISTFLYEQRPGGKLFNVVIALEKLTCLKCADKGRGEEEIPIGPVGP